MTCLFVCAAHRSIFSMSRETERCAYTRRYISTSPVSARKEGDVAGVFMIFSRLSRVPPSLHATTRGATSSIYHDGIIYTSTSLHAKGITAFSRRDTLPPLPQLHARSLKLRGVERGRGDPVTWCLRRQVVVITISGRGGARFEESPSLGSLAPSMVPVCIIYRHVYVSRVRGDTLNILRRAQEPN